MTGVEFVAETLRIPAGHETCARRAAIGAAHVGVGEADSFSSDPIDVGCWNIPAAVNADVRVADVVGHNQPDVVVSDRSPLANGTGDGQKDGGRGNRPHDGFHVPPGLAGFRPNSRKLTHAVAQPLLLSSRLPTARVFLRRRFTNTVTSGAFNCIPLISRSRKGASTSRSRRVRYGLIPVSICFRPAPTAGSTAGASAWLGLVFAEAYDRTMGLNLTAVFQKVPEGYIGFVEELPGANTQGATLEEARANLQEAVALVLEANRGLIDETKEERSFASL